MKDKLQTREQMLAGMTTSEQQAVPVAQEVPGEGWSDDWKAFGFNGAIRQAQEALRFLANNDRPSGGEQFPNSACCYMIADELEITRKRYAALSLPCKLGEGAGQCPASSDHADIKDTIKDAADDWQAKGYTSALAEVRDMAAVGRSLMEALPKGYCYMDSPAEIVSDLQNDLDEARGIFPNLTSDHLAGAGKPIDATQTREAELVAALKPWQQLFADFTGPVDEAWFDRFKDATYAARAALNARGDA